MLDTEQTGKKLLTHGQLKRRVTFIPLNKIAGYSISADKIRRAEQLVSIDTQVAVEFIIVTVL